MLVAPQGFHQHVAAGRAGLVQLPHGAPANAALQAAAPRRELKSTRRRACRKVARACRACCSSAYAEDRRRFLLNYVQHCDDPGVIIESFLEHAPTQARSPVHASTARHCRGLRVLMPAQEQACCSP